MKSKFGFSLTEMLVVVLIIVLLAGLLFPIFVKVKNRSLDVPCTANLKQVGIAWQLYAEANNDQMPLTLATLIAANPSVKPAVTCPADRWRGANSQESERIRGTVSYLTLDPRPSFRTAILEADSNHGIAACICHGRSLNANGSTATIAEITGKVLRLRLDLSVKSVDIEHRCGPNTSVGRLSGRNKWSLLTDAPCLGDLCDGLTESCR